MPIHVRFDAEALPTVAQLTSTECFHAGSGADASKVGETLNARCGLERRQTEISALVGALAAVPANAAEGLSLLWFSRIA